MSKKKKIEREVVERELAEYRTPDVSFWNPEDETVGAYLKRLDSQMKKIQRFRERVEECAGVKGGYGERIVVDAEHGHIRITAYRRETVEEAEARVKREEAAQKRQEKARREHEQKCRLRRLASAVREIERDPDLYREAFDFLTKNPDEKAGK